MLPQYPHFKKEDLSFDSDFASIIRGSPNQSSPSIEFLKTVQNKLLDGLNATPSQTTFIKQKQICEFINYEIETYILLEILSGRWEKTNKLNISASNFYNVGENLFLDTKISNILQTLLNSNLQSNEENSNKKSILSIFKLEELNPLVEKIETLKLIIFWLEECERSSSNMNESIQKFSKWDHSLNDIKNLDKLNKFSFDGISEIDPDAVNRQKRNLNRRDFTNDEVILKQIWKHLRSGDISKILECVKNGKQTWRGASLRFPLLELEQHIHSDETFNLAKLKGLKLAKLKDLESLFLYIFSVQKMLGNPSLRISSIEQSIFGTLSGHLNSAQSVCERYEDYLWANSTVSLLSTLIILLLTFYKRVEKSEIIQFSNQASLEPIIENLLSLLSKETQKPLSEVLNVPQKSLQEFTPYFYEIQKLLIKKDYYELIHTLYRIIFDENGYLKVSMALYSNFLRFSSSLIIYLLNDDIISNKIRLHPNFSQLQEFIHEIIKNYILYLKSIKEYSYITFFSNYLSKDLNEELYSNILKDVDIDANSRDIIYKQAKKNKLNLDRITSSMIQSTDPNLSDDKNFKNKIYLISFLQQDKDRIFDVLKYINDLIREIVISKKFYLPQELMKIISEIDLEINLSEVRDHSAILQFLEFKSWIEFFEGINLYKEWNSYNLNIPKGSHIDYNCKKISEYLTIQNQKLIENNTFKEWILKKIDLMNKLKTIPSTLLNVVKMNYDELQNMDQVFKIAITQIIFLMIDILLRSECYEECLLLSHFVASDTNGFYHAFSQNDLIRFLNLMSNAQQNYYQNMKK